MMIHGLTNSKFIRVHLVSNKLTNKMQQFHKFRSDRPRPTTLLPPRSNGKPEAATAVYKLLMRGMRMPETC